MENKTRDEIADELINEFMEKFHKALGVYPLVTYSMRKITMVRVSLSELESLTNEVYQKWFPEAYVSDGIRNRLRRRTTVAFRQVYMKIASDMGHSLDSTGRFIGYDHATVLHAKRNVNNLLDCKDPEITKIYNLVYYAAKERYGHDGDVRQNDGGKSVAEPVLPSVLHEGEHISDNNQHSSDTP